MTTEAGQDLRSGGETATGDFEPEQKRYLEGFVAGLQIAKTARGVAGAGRGARALRPLPSRSARTRPRAWRRTVVLAAGGKLSDPEKFKREENPFDTYERLKDLASRNEYPKPPDNFRWRFFGLFYVAPNQNSYMCRLRIPNGIVKAHQFAGLAELAERYGGGYAHVTTRANIQIREIEAKNAVVHARRSAGPRPMLARLGRRQYPQRHRHADRRHRPARADRHAPLRARMAFPYPQRARALRPAAQVQRRLRRRRRHSGAGGHQRYRLPGGGGEGRLRLNARHLVPALPRRLDRALELCRRHRRDRASRRTPPKSPTPWCACSSTPATAPTAPRRG